MPLPYENATSGRRATADIQRTLRAFGASALGIVENFDAGEVVLQFEWNRRRVMIKMGFKGYADLWLKHNPQGPRARLSEEEYKGRALQKGEVAVWSILRDWIKAQITAIEVGMLTFESAFLSQIMLSGGRTVFEVVHEEGMLQIAAA